MREAAEEGGLGYTATFEVVPEVTLADLAEQSVTRPVAEVAEADIDAMIEKLRKQRTVWTDVDRGAKDGDTVHLDFKGMIDGEIFEGGSCRERAAGPWFGFDGRGFRVWPARRQAGR